MVAIATSTFTMDILSVIFFSIAGLWLLAALFYSLMALCFLRRRADGRLGSVHAEDFGRVPLCCDRCYLPLGCIFRWFARHLNLEDDDDNERPNASFFTREERRAAMEALLLERNTATSGGRTFLQRHLERRKNKQEGNIAAGGPKPQTVETESSSPLPESTPSQPQPPPAAAETPDLEEAGGGDANVGGDDDQWSDNGGPICSICLGDYSEEAASDAVFCPKTCSHQFHEGCILDWLQRHSNAACPCCRVAMVTEEEVWNTVKRLRREKRNQLRRERQKLGKRQDRANNEEEEISETEEDLEFEV